jgi:hypothetical protein
MPEIQREGLGFRSSPTQYSVNFQSSLGDFDVGGKLAKYAIFWTLTRFQIGMWSWERTNMQVGGVLVNYCIIIASDCFILWCTTVHQTFHKIYYFWVSILCRASPAMFSMCPCKNIFHIPVYFSSVFFPKPTQKTKIGTANRWEMTNCSPPGAIKLPSRTNSRC